MCIPHKQFRLLDLASNWPEKEYHGERICKVHKQVQMRLGLHEQKTMTKSNFNYAGESLPYSQVETWKRNEYKQGIV